MNIQEQQAIANEILDKLSIISPHCILAGGAPRDWYMEEECNDLDIYFSLDEGLQYRLQMDQIKRVLPDFEFTGEYHPERSAMYKHMKNLKCIHYGRYKGMEVQLIQMVSVGAVFSVVNDIDCSVCKIWYKNGVITPTKMFLDTLDTGVMTLTENYCWDDMHPAKMAGRFKGIFTKG